MRRRVLGIGLKNFGIKLNDFVIVCAGGIKNTEDVVSIGPMEIIVVVAIKEKRDKKSSR